MSPGPPGQAFSPNGAGLPQRPGYGPPGSGMSLPPGAPGPFDANASAVDDLISSVVKESEAKVSNGTSTPAEAATEKKSKKSDKSTRLVYGDNDTSPEEKMARLGRYAFTRDTKEEVVLGEVGGAVTGIATGEDTVLDRPE
jgi:hypothetical protein